MKGGGSMFWNKRGAKKMSAAQRRTSEIAELCGFEYDFRQSRYGCFFTVYQLELIENKIKEGVKRCENYRSEKNLSEPNSAVDNV